MELKLVDIDQLSELLNLPKKWLYVQTSPEGRKKIKKKGKTPLPLYHMGKYVRFKIGEVEEWLNQFKE